MHARAVLAALLGAVVSLAAAGCKKKLPPDFEEVVGRGRAAADVVESIRRAYPPRGAPSTLPRCEGGTMASIIESRTQLFGEVAPPGGFVDDRRYETSPGSRHGPFLDEPAKILERLERDRQGGRMSLVEGDLQSLRQALTTLERYDGIAVYEVSSVLGAIEGTVGDHRRQGVFTGGTLKARVLLFDRKTGRGVCQSDVTAGSSATVRGSLDEDLIRNMIDGIRESLRSPPRAGP